MDQVRNLNEARALIAELSEQVDELSSLRERSAKVEALQAELDDAKAIFDTVSAQNADKIAKLEAGAKALASDLEAAAARVKQLESEAKSAEVRAREIVGDLGGAPLPVDSSTDETLTVESLVKAINAEKDPIRKHVLYKQYKQKQKGK
jgi:chromosome segregation ATPase